MGTFLSFYKNILVLFLILLSLILLDSFLKSAHAGSVTVLINEVMYDPTGTDTGYEWIELYNSSNQEIDITNWTIQIAGTSFKTNATLSGQIQPESLFLICEPNVQECDPTVPKLAFQNGGGATDGIQILNSTNTVIDSIFYDSPNSNLLTDEGGIVVSDERTSAVVNSGESLGRETSVDTDNYSEDFTKFTIPTPGQENVAPIEDEEEDDGELEQTGSSPLLLIFIFSAFLLTIYSARLIKYYKFSKHTNGSSKI